MPRPSKTSEKLINSIAEMVTPSKDVKENHSRVAHLTLEQLNFLDQIEKEAITNFVGVLDELEAALGMLRIGHHVGCKVLYLVHSKKTIHKYEDILGIKIRDLFDETGPNSYRSVGLGISEKFSNFWKFVSGDIKPTRE